MHSIRLNDINFRMNVNAELSLDVFYYALIKTDNVIASSSSLIDKDKSLTVMHSGTSQRTSLPSALLYHPSCRNLDMVGIDNIVGHVLVL